MTKTLQKVIEEESDFVVDYIMDHSKFEDGEFLFAMEFSGEKIAEGVANRCVKFQIEITPTLDNKRPFARTVRMSQLMKTKLLVAKERAERSLQYKKQGREVDFKQHGIEWKPASSTSSEDYSTKNKIYVATYGKLNL